MRLVTSAAVFMLFTGAQAQDRAPANVNDCTFLINPPELRNCIDSFEQWRPPTLSSSDLGFEIGPDVTGSIFPRPRPVKQLRFKASAQGASRFKMPLKPSEKTRIEQIER
jgi:hypothetical protein